MTFQNRHVHIWPQYTSDITVSTPRNVMYVYNVYSFEYTVIGNI